MIETLDSIRDIKIYQPKKGYRFSIDSVLLGHFITNKAYKKAIEFGTGCGIISLILAKVLKQTSITAVEVQDSMVEIAQKNVSLNHCEDRINVLHEDINHLPFFFQPGTFDLVFSNPPFRKLNTGHINPIHEKSIARHEILINLESLIKTAAFVLDNRGVFALVYQPVRLAELIRLLQNYRLEPKRMRLVHNCITEPATIVLLEAIKGAGTWLDVEPPLILRNNNGEYTNEVTAFLLE